MKSIILGFALCTGIALGCHATAETPRLAQPSPQAGTCEDPRPEICTHQYQPVCGSRDTGVRCVTTPCPSTELRTYGNACSACADEKVDHYTPGACAENESSNESEDRE